MSAGGLVETTQVAETALLANATAVPAVGLGVPVAPATPAESGALARAARAGADMVGDACVVWRVLGDGRLEPAATFHRDRRARYALGEFVQQQPLESGELWPGQVAVTAAPIRARRIRLSSLGVEAAVGMRRAHALVVPVLEGGRAVAVVAALRDSGEPEYSLREELVLRRVGVKAAASLGAPAAGDGGDGNDGGGDGDGAGRGGEPPSDGPGWSPPPAWLMDHVGVGVWVADREGVTSYVNNAMSELLGVPATDVVGRPMRDFLEDVPQMVRGEYCMDAERCDRRLTQPDGRHVWVEMTSLPLVDDGGARRGTVNSAVDVTDRKKVELAARQRVPRVHRRF
jgi:PAS domain S-box-containing protein